MKVELKNNLGTVYTSTQDVETTIRHNPEKLCKNCKHWERNEKTLPFIWGWCDLFGNSFLTLPQPTDRVSVIESGTFALTGENFGCIHFQEKK